MSGGLGTGAFDRTLALSVYRLILRLYPISLRERHGREMAQAFRDRIARERRRGGGAVRRVTGLLLRDLALSLPAAWRAERAQRRTARSLARGTSGMARAGQELVSDLRLGARWLWRSPGTAALAVLTLALGIGANTAMFSLLDGILLRPLPYPEPHRVVRILPSRALSAAQLDAIAEQTSSFEALGVIAPTTLTLVGDGPPIEVAATLASPTLFEILGVAPVVGRALTGQDAVVGAEPVALLSWDLWQHRFGGDDSVVGRQVRLGGRGESTRTVVGVLPAGFDAAPWGADALLPVVVDPGSHDYEDMIMFWGLGRLGDGVTIGAASSELRAVTERLVNARDPLFTEAVLPDARVVTYLDARVGRVRPRLLLLLGAVAVVLLIACTNVANLLLARAGERRDEIVVRSALGAGQGRLVRQLLTESAVLALVGGAAGAVFAAVTLVLLRGTLQTVLPRIDQVTVDFRVLVFTLALSIASGLVFGAVPALRSAGAVSAANDQGRRATGGRRRLLLNRVLVGAEVALCVVLLVAAGLLSKSLLRLVTVDPGFEPEGAVSLRVVPPEGSYPDEDSRRQLYQRLTEALAATPGVESAGAVNLLPLSRGGMGVGISPDGDPVADTEDPLNVSYRLVTPGYRRALGIPLLAGRDLVARDRADGQAVGLINEALARRLFPDRQPLGESLHWDNGEPWLTVVGVVGDIRQSSLEEDARPEVYVPYGQESWIAAMNLVVRGAASTSLLDTARTVIGEVDSGLPISRETTLSTVVRQSVASATLYSRLFLAFGLVALVLAVIGIYGVVAYSVGQRRREIGVRIAIGAATGDVLRSVVGNGMAAVAVGLLVGGGAALVLSRLLGGLLFEVQANDPLILLGALGFLGVVALLACLVPALRASRVDPIETLGAE